LASSCNSGEAKDGGDKDVDGKQGTGRRAEKSRTTEAGRWAHAFEEGIGTTIEGSYSIIDLPRRRQRKRRTFENIEMLNLPHELPKHCHFEMHAYFLQGVC